MKLQDVLKTVLFGILGILAAVAIALAADAISGEEIGLSSEPVSIVNDDSNLAAKPADRHRGKRDRVESTEPAQIDDHGGASSGSGGDGGGSGSGSSGTSGTSGSSGSGTSPSGDDGLSGTTTTRTDNSGPGSLSSGSGGSGGDSPNSGPGGGDD